MDLGRFITELKRRRVFRVAAVYAVVGWVLVQIADTTFPTSPSRAGASPSSSS